MECINTMGGFETTWDCSYGKQKEYQGCDIDKQNKVKAKSHRHTGNREISLNMQDTGIH